jgi:hypothetical protein
MLTGCCTVRWQLHVMGLLDDTMCKECEQKEDTFDHTLCQCPGFAVHRMEIITPVWLCQ